MDVRLITASGIERRDRDELPDLLQRDEGVVWVDIPVCDTDATQVLSEVFHFHRVAIRDCVERNHVSKVFVYSDHAFVVLHAPEVGQRGHVHYVELDQFIGRNYLVTVHGPLNPAVDPQVAFTDTNLVLHRIEEKHLQINSPFELSHWIVSTLIRRELELVGNIARDSGQLEQQVMLADENDEDPEALLAKLFQTWYVLLAVRTMATHSAASYNRMARLVTFLPDSVPPLLADISDQFEMVQIMADGQREFLRGVIEYYQTLLSTHITVAAEQSAEASVRQNDDMRKITAWVAIVAVPTAVTGYFGQNVPYPGFQDRAGFIASALLIILGALAMYLIFKRKEWL